MFDPIVAQISMSSNNARDRQGTERHVEIATETEKQTERRLRMIRGLCLTVWLRTHPGYPKPEGHACFRHNVLHLGNRSRRNTPRNVHKLFSCLGMEFLFSLFRALLAFVFFKILFLLLCSSPFLCLPFWV